MRRERRVYCQAQPKPVHPTHPSQGLNLTQAAEGADNMSHRTCPIGPMAPGTKDSSPRAGGWDKNYKLATAASNAMGRAPSHPPRTAGRGRIQQRLIWKDGIKADSRPVTQSLPETYKELLIYQQHTNRYTRHDGAGPRISCTTIRGLAPSLQAEQHATSSGVAPAAAARRGLLHIASASTGHEGEHGPVVFATQSRKQLWTGSP